LFLGVSFFCWIVRIQCHFDDDDDDNDGGDNNDSVFVWDSFVE